MKELSVLLFLMLSLILVSFSRNTENFSSSENWYLCSNCCKTKKATSAPWEKGCKQSSSRTHNYQFCGKAGNFNYTCRKCDAEVYLKQGSSPSASKCCAIGSTHTWYHN